MARETWEVLLLFLLQINDILLAPPTVQGLFILFFLIYFWDSKSLLLNSMSSRLSGDLNFGMIIDKLRLIVLRMETLKGMIRSYFTFSDGRKINAFLIMIGTVACLVY